MAWLSPGSTLYAEQKLANVEYAVSGGSLGISAFLYKSGNIVAGVDSEDSAKDEMVGICLTNSPAADKPVIYAVAGEIVNMPTISMTPGESYYASGATIGVGQIGLFSDLVAAREYVVLVGVALSSTKLLLVCESLGVQL